ncbi:MAG: hypothetical protein EZS28_011501 [Streblomastix strix]|uniref:Uncharacterized protein n=1 Tax=Streblomastix strix TaxID=222440 RepID=A0A5J4WE68_9EUKA|nr:MAG: hypothetical protein EZS28_011501 [Streblomastix strix]
MEDDDEFVRVCFDDDYECFEDVDYVRVCLEDVEFVCFVDVEYVRQCFFIDNENVRQCLEDKGDIILFDYEDQEGDEKVDGINIASVSICY